jgi:hypothetical protein
VPGFFLGAASGVVADRFDRKKVMVVCNIGRAFWGWSPPRWCSSASRCCGPRRRRPRSPTWSRPTT